MAHEGRVTGSLDSGRGAGQQQPRSRWSRRSSHGHPRHDDARGGSDHPAPTYAALDLGTNNCRLLVARPAGDSFRVIDAFSRIIRLGEGVSSSRRISEAAIERAVDALAVCRDKMKSRGVTRARLIATEACRAADNGVEFHARIAEEVGLDLDIIDRETEATLAATGCTPLMDPYADGAILFARRHPGEAPRRPGSEPGYRSLSAWSRWPSATADTWSRPAPMPR
jgi:exopolyphosphatase/guanosine-5'-triphosphate,3'-diphosphate pyrophosphatase